MKIDKKYIIEKEGKKYVKIGNRAVEFEDYDENGIPIIKPKIEKTKHKNGKVDIKITIPSLRINQKTNGKSNI